MNIISFAIQKTMEISQFPIEKYIFHENLQQYFLLYSQQSETPSAPPLKEKCHLEAKDTPVYGWMNGKSIDSIRFRYNLSVIVILGNLG